MLHKLYTSIYMLYFYHMHNLQQLLLGSLWFEVSTGAFFSSKMLSTLLIEVMTSK